MIIESLGRLPPNSRLFLAEGASEAGFIQKVLNLSNDGDSLVYCFKGLSKLPLILKSIADVPGFDRLQSLGLMLDAETDFNARLVSVAHHFDVQGVVLTADDIKNSRVTNQGSCRIGVYISPGNASSGRIEDTTLLEIQSSKIWPCIKSYADCAEGALGRELDKKSLVQTYISSKKGGLCGMGRAFQANILDVTHSAYDIPRNFVRSLI